MKSGTTSLFHYLSHHSKIVPPEYKEPAFFAWHFDKGYDWYLSKFLKKEEKGDRLTFEATPLYFHLKESPERIKRYLPDIKLIVVLRNPVDRAFSHWNFFNNSNYVNETNFRKQNLKDTRTFREAVKQELSGILRSENHSYLKYGYYLEQIKYYLNYFDIDQMLFLDFDELKSDLSCFLGRICNFLSIEDEFKDAIYNSKKEDKLIYKFSPSKRKGAKNSFSVYNFNKKPNEMSMDLYLELLSFFRERNKGLNELTNNNFKWNN